MQVQSEGKASAFNELKSGTFFGFWRDKIMYGVSLTFADKPAAALFTKHPNYNGSPWVTPNGLNETVVAFGQAVLRPDPASLILRAAHAPIGSVVISPTGTAFKVALEMGDYTLFDVVTGAEQTDDLKNTAYYTRWSIGFDRPSGFAPLFTPADTLS